MSNTSLFDKVFNLVSEAYSDRLYEEFKDIEEEKGFKIIRPEEYSRIIKKTGAGSWWNLEVADLTTFGNAIGEGMYRDNEVPPDDSWVPALIIEADNIPFWIPNCDHYAIVRNSKKIWVIINKQVEDMTETQYRSFVRAGGRIAYLKPNVTYKDYTSKDTTDEFGNLMDEL